MELEEVNSPLRYWLALSNSPSNRFSVLTNLTLDVFSIPTMSAKCKHIFSETKHLIWDNRTHLLAKTIQVIQSQRTLVG